MRRIRAAVFGVLGAVVVAWPAAWAGAEEIPESHRDAIKEGLERINPGLYPESLRPTPLEGLYEVVVNGRLVYMSEDGRYLIQGEILDLDGQHSISEEYHREQRLDTLADLPEEELVVYPAADGGDHVVTIFTDVECPFCQRLHAEMRSLQERGIEVRYVLMPRSVPSSAYRKSVAVYCAEDRRSAMDAAKGGELQGDGGEECPNPIQEHVQIAETLGIRATPTLISKDGRMHEGYLSPEDLEAFLKGELEH